MKPSQQQIPSAPDIPTGETISQITPLTGIISPNLKVKIDRTNSQEVQIKPQGASIVNVFANITKSGMGLGLLFMPFAFKECGILIPILFLLIVGLACFYCWNLLGISLRRLESDPKYHENPQYIEHSNNLTLDNSIAIVCSPKWRIIPQVANGINILGSCIVYVIFITTQLEAIGVNFFFSILGIGLIFFPLCFLKSIKAYGKFSLIALGIYFSVLIFIIVSSSIEIHNETYSHMKLKLTNWESIPNFIGVFILLFDINGTVSIAHASMQHKNKFWISLSMYLVTSCLLSIFIGLLAYLGFRDATKAFIFETIKSISGVKETFLVLYCLTLVMGICLYGFVITQMIDTIFLNSNSASAVSKKKSIIVKVSVRIGYFLLVSGVAYLFPKAKDLFNVIGCVTGVTLTYVLPCFLYEKMTQSSKWTGIRILNLCIVVISVISGILGLVYSIKSIVNKKE